MILELILIVAIVGIFILIVRRLPEALNEGKAQSAAPSPKPEVTRPAISSASGPSWLSRLAAILPTFGTSNTSTSSIPASTIKPLETGLPLSTEITAESLLKEGDQYLEDGKLKEAERSYLRAVAKEPKQPRLYNRLGAIYLKDRNFGDALQAFEAARDLDGSKASRHYNVALAAWQGGKLAKARESISQAISLDPTAQKYQDLKEQIEGK